MASVRAVGNYANLLASEVSLYLQDGLVCRLPYNTVSSDIMDQVVAFIRNQLDQAGKTCHLRYHNTETPPSLEDHLTLRYGKSPESAATPSS